MLSFCQIIADIYALISSVFLSGFLFYKIVFFLLRYVDAVLTIPKGTLFPMCGMNLAFNRELIGPALYFGLMGDGQPIGRYDDMWAGWCMKVFQISILLN
jgi:hypothetical protein